MKKTVICLVGGSGSGKTTLANYMADEGIMPTIVSYTTRPKRMNEVEGRDHIFVCERDVPPDETLAYTVYGSYEYWTLPQQIDADVVSYVIDEAGVNDLMERWGKEYDIVKVFIDRPLVMRAAQVGMERVQRDRARRASLNGEYDLVIFNDTMSVKYFCKKAAKAIEDFLSDRHERD